jgi:hypothetical protein
MSVALVLAGPSRLHLILEGFLWNQLHLLTFQVVLMPLVDFAINLHLINFDIGEESGLNDLLLW